MADPVDRTKIEDTDDRGNPTASYGGAAAGPGEQIGPYKLLRVLGEGGYGIVYLAEQQRPVKRRVALKVIKPGMDTKQVIARFEAERQALALLDHPNIAHVFNAGTTDTGRPYFAMEYVKGVPITEHCDRCKLTIEERLKLFLAVCEAVQHAHQKAIIHRDIKPSNILVAYEGEQAVPMIIDFGVAKALTHSLTERTLVTEQAQMIGTPEYMSPEQAEMSGQDIDTRTDIYSLGVLLYELLTGTLPFDPQTLREGGPEQMRRMIREQDPQTPSARLSAVEKNESLGLAEHRRTDVRTLGHRLHGELDWITLKAMDKDRTRRYQTAHAFAEDIQRYLDQEPVLAGPPSTLYKVQKFVKRNRTLFISTAAIVAILILATVISLWQMVCANRAAERERKISNDLEIQRDRAVQAEKVAKRESERARIQELAARRMAYASEMNLAAQALSARNLGRARELLNRHRPSTSDAGFQDTVDLRGWEWRYLWQECQGDALDGFRYKIEDIVNSLSISHDGRYLAAGGYFNNGVVIWDLHTRKKLTTLFPNDKRVRAIFSPASDLLAITSIPDPAGVAGPGGGFPWVLRFWDPTTREVTFEQPLEGLCIGLKFSDDGRTLITATHKWRNQHKITCWNVSQGKELMSFPYNSSYCIVQGTPFAVARDLSLAVHPLYWSQIRVIDLDKRKPLWSEVGAEEGVAAFELTSDGKILASGAGFTESAIRLWDVVTGKEIGRLEGHRAWISDLLFCRDDKVLISASGDQTIRMWDVSDPNEGKLIRTLRGHVDEVYRIALHPDNKTLISGDKSGLILAWNLDASKRDNTLVIANIADYAFTPDGQGILVLDYEGVMAHYRTSDFRRDRELFHVGENAICFRTCISPETGMLAVNSVDGVIRIRDLADGTLLHSLDDRVETKPITFFKKGKQLLTINRKEDSYDIWDVAKEEKMQSWFGASKIEENFAPVLSPDERRCLTVQQGNTHILIEMETQHEIRKTFDMQETSGVAFSPDARLIAASSNLGFIKVWDARTFDEIATYRGFLMAVHGVTFSPDGKRLAAGGDGMETIKIWDVESHQELLNLPGRGSIHHHVAFSPDNNTLGSLNNSGLLHLWRAHSWEEIEAAEKVSSDQK
ncbi:MAG: protein kinase [Sedimentisphaerales bacterium]|nr:protein kinase [Sedimentisphaerales bacterium]